jgi:hydroxyacylglutathione hydrolase
MLYVRQLTYGPMKNFIHLVGMENAREVAVVDPAWNVAGLLEVAAEAGKQVVAAILTHSHQDHINGVPELLKVREIPVYAQQAEIDFNPRLREFGGALKAVRPGEKVQIGPLEVTLIHTPGHTPGSLCLYCGGALFSGDTLFVDHCGRCDFPGSDVAQMFHSLHTVLGALPAQTALYPGHDYGSVPVSTLLRERALNPYLLRTDLESFSDYRLRPRS